MSKTSFIKGENNILCYFLDGSFYRENIYKKMNDELECDFIFGESILNIKQLNYKLITNLKMTPERKFIFGSKIWFDKGVISFYLKHKYKTIIIGGDAYNITVWLILLLSWFQKKNVLIWTHGYYGREKWYIKWVKKIFFSFGDKILLYGNYAKGLLIKDKIASPDKLIVVYNSLNYEMQLIERNKLIKEPLYQNHFGNNNSNIIFIGRLTNSKRLEMIIEALYILKTQGENYNVTFIGVGESLGNLVNEVKRLNLNENVWFIGSCFEESVLAKMIYNADLCISPGNVGLTAIHSLMYGTPVITHDNFPFQGPEFEAIQNESTGLFFKQNDIASLTKTIKKWFLANLEREQIRLACYEIVDEKYNSRNQIEIMKSILN